MPNSLISVIVPIFNQQDYCGDTIKSVLMQTYENFELIVVNDGSTDSSLEVIYDTIKNESKVIVINQENLGPSEAINTALNAASGEYIALCGGDDICSTTRLKNQLDLMLTTSSDILFSIPRLIDDGGNEIDDNTFPIFTNIPKNFKTNPYRSLFYHGNFLCAPTAFFKSKLIKEIGCFNENLIQLQDFDLWMRALSKGKKIYISQERDVSYRRHANNLSANTNNSLLYGEYQFLLPKILDDTPTEILRENFSDILIPSYPSTPLSNYEKASILLASPLVHSKIAGLHKLLQLNDQERNYIFKRGIKLNSIIRGAFISCENTNQVEYELELTRAALDNILQSNSWKITKPIRLLKNLITGRVNIGIIFKRFLN